MTRRGDTALTLMAAAACVVAPVLALTAVHGPARVAATLVLVALAPGAALLGRATARELGLVLATSLAVCVVVAQAMLALGVWDPRAATAGLAVISLPRLVIRLYRQVGNRPDTGSWR